MENTQVQLELFTADELPPAEQMLRFEIPAKPTRQAVGDLLKEIIQLSPSYRLLECVPLTEKKTQFPYRLSPATDDAKEIIFLDTETTGLSHEDDVIIELGMVVARYSPGENRLLSIERVLSLYEDPGRPIAPEITAITGITNEMLAGQHIDDEQVAEFIGDIDTIIAHNAGFDRPFFEKRFKALNGLSWGCSLNGIDWASLGFTSRRQEELLLYSGYFYEAHRASIDCLALSWLMHIQPKAFSLLLKSIQEKTIIVHAFQAPFDAKDQLKARGYRWDDGSTGAGKHWWRAITESLLDEERAFLDSLYSDGANRASYTIQTAMQRFRI